MEVGDYVRTNNGGIGKIINCPFKSMYLDEIWGDIEDTETIITDNVYKTSPNIIDLIEVGDYVNGKRVIKVWEEPFGEFAGQIFTILEGEEAAPTIRTIKSIVTKEQFERMEYKCTN